MIHVRALSGAIVQTCAAMKPVLNRRTVLSALVAALAISAPARADDRGERKDHDRARQALEEGRARPLAEILAQVKDRLGGEIIGVEFERKDRRYVYEFKVVTPGGRLREVYVDALTAEILRSKDE
jgi:uncharacterized membrane protein YkoI